MIKVLHVASFSGNIGDNANHYGLRQRIEKYLGHSIQYTELEIRKFYQNYREPDRLSFDNSFAKLANEHDHVVIGGGNFFEIWLENSATGTTIDMPIEVVETIETPIFFFGLGFDPYKGVPEGNIDKFKRFIDHLYDRKIHTITVRNDGSLKHVKHLLGTDYLNKIEKIPDGGFFLHIDAPSEKTFNIKYPFIAINVAKDMKDLRFIENDFGLSYESFITSFSDILNRFLFQHPSLEIVFVPHIFSDLDAIHDVLQHLKDVHRRNRVSVAPLLHGENSEQEVFDIYRKALFSMGMRFHTNVCSIALNTPTIGLASYPKLIDLYDEIGFPERVVPVNQKGFGDKLYLLMSKTIASLETIKMDYSHLTSRLDYESEKIFQKHFG